MADLCVDEGNGDPIVDEECGQVHSKLVDLLGTHLHTSTSKLVDSNDDDYYCGDCSC